MTYVCNTKVDIAWEHDQVVIGDGVAVTRVHDFVQRVPISTVLKLLLQVHVLNRAGGFHRQVEIQTL